MKLSIICFSLTGLETAIRLKTEFEKQGHRVLLASKSKYLKDSIQESVLKWTESRFSADDGISAVFKFTSPSQMLEISFALSGI